MADQGEAYATHIETELQAEYGRTNVLNARATAVTTSSSAFLALVLSLAALVAGRDFVVEEASARGVAVSLALFTAASVSGFVAALSRKYKVTAVDTLLQMIGPHWGDNDVDARNAVAYTNVITIRSLREGNNFKATSLIVAATLQLAAVAVLILAIAVHFAPQLR